MTIKNSLALQVTDLLSSLAAHGSQHLTEAETDLVQTNILLSEAIEKLTGSFMAIHAAVTAQQHIVNALLASAAVSSEAVLALRTQAVQIDQHVNAAVTGLQFQDMTNQLISRSMHHIVGLRDVLEMLRAKGVTIPAEASNEQMMIILVQINALLKTQSANLEKELLKTVCQTQMESGDIELF